MAYEQEKHAFLSQQTAYDVTSAKTFVACLAHLGRCPVAEASSPFLSTATIANDDSFFLSRFPAYLIRNSEPFGKHEGTLNSDEQ